MNNRLKREIRTDSLTKTFNRKAIFDILKHEIERSKRNEESLSICILDIDDFKKINDTYGHISGDTVIKEVADVVVQSVRSIDYVGRWGGEEFIVVMPSTCIDEAITAANRISGNIRNLEIISSDRSIRTTATIGVSALYEADTCESLLEKADKNLYKGKSGSKNCVVHG